MHYPICEFSGFIFSIYSDRFGRFNIDRIRTDSEDLILFGNLTKMDWKYFGSFSTMMLQDVFCKEITTLAQRNIVVLLNLNLFLIGNIILNVEYKYIFYVHVSKKSSRVNINLKECCVIEYFKTIVNYQIY